MCGGRLAALRGVLAAAPQAQNCRVRGISLQGWDLAARSSAALFLSSGDEGRQGGEDVQEVQRPGQRGDGDRCLYRVREVQRPGHVGTALSSRERCLHSVKEAQSPGHVETAQSSWELLLNEV